MDIDLARHIVRTSFRCSREMRELLPLIKKQAREDEYQDYARAIAASIAAIQLEIVNKVTSDHPGLEAEIEASVTKYDRVL